MKLPAHRAGLPGNVDMITGSAFLPAYKAGHPADLPVTFLDPIPGFLVRMPI